MKISFIYNIALCVDYYIYPLRYIDAHVHAYAYAHECMKTTSMALHVTT